MWNSNAHPRPHRVHWRCRSFVWVPLWWFIFSTRPATGEIVSDKLLPSFAEAGRICLAAKHERDVEPALAVIRSLKTDLTQTKAPSADLSRVEGALNFLLKWQTFLNYCDTARWGDAGGMALHLSNLPMGHLMVPRAAIRDRYTQQMREESAPPLSAPQDIRKVSDEGDRSGSFDLVWTNPSPAEFCSISRDDRYGEYREIAILPPNVDSYHPVASDAKPTSAEALAVERAAGVCLRATQVEELEPALKELASYWRGGRSTISPSERAEQSRIDCALMFVGWWQDSLADLRIEKRDAAAKRLRRLASTNRDYPPLEPARILERAAAADPNVSDFVEHSEQ